MGRVIKRADYLYLCLFRRCGKLARLSNLDRRQGAVQVCPNYQQIRMKCFRELYYLFFSRFSFLYIVICFTRL